MILIIRYNTVTVHVYYVYIQSNQNIVLQKVTIVM